jgi:hypothetical protein
LPWCRARSLPSRRRTVASDLLLYNRGALPWEHGFTGMVQEEVTSGLKSRPGLYCLFPSKAGKCNQERLCLPSGLSWVLGLVAPASLCGGERSENTKSATRACLSSTLLSHNLDDRLHGIGAARTCARVCWSLRGWAGAGEKVALARVRDAVTAHVRVWCVARAMSGCGQHAKLGAMLQRGRSDAAT